MTSKNIIIGVAGVAILGVGVFLGSTLNNGSSPANAPGTTVRGTSAGATPPDTADASKGATPTKPRPRTSAWANLTEKYGDSRTKLSKKVTEDMAKVADEAMELADMGATFAGGKSAKDLATTQAMNSLASRLNLTDEQKAKATEIVRKRVDERMNALKELSGAMRDDPAPMMEALLAGDAYSRKEITEDEYNQASKDTLGLLKNVAGMGFGGFGGGSNISDPVLADQLQSMLTPEQQQQLADIIKQTSESTAAGGQGRLPFQNGTLPVMDLEKLDQSMQSAQKLTGGIRAMMEGFKGLQQTMPQNGNTQGGNP